MRSSPEGPAGLAAEEKVEAIGEHQRLVGSLSCSLFIRLIAVRTLQLFKQALNVRADIFFLRHLSK